MKHALIICAASILVVAAAPYAYAKDPWKKYYKQEMKREKAFYKIQNKNNKHWQKYHRKYEW